MELPLALAAEPVNVAEERLQRILQQFGISADGMSRSGLTSLRTLSEVGNQLGLNDMKSSM